VFWDKDDKKSKSIYEYYQNKKLARDYDWKEFYKPEKKKSGFNWGGQQDHSIPGRRTFYRIVAVLSILVVLYGIKQMNNPAGEDIRQGLRYVLTTDWDVRPVIEKAVNFGLQMAGMDNQLNSGSTPDGILQEASAKPVIATGMLIPVSGKVICQYGWGKDPLDDMDRFHHGIDIAASPGTPVKATLSGKVIKIGSSRQYGRYVLVDHNDGLFTLYAGMGNLKISEGQAVKAGDTIGDIAKNSDTEDGVLHFELREGANLVDPLLRLDLPK